MEIKKIDSPRKIESGQAPTALPSLHHFNRHFDTSSITPATPASGHYLRPLIELGQKFEEAISEETRFVSGRIKQHLKKIPEMDQQLSQLAENFGQKVERHHNWSKAATAVEGISSAASIVSSAVLLSQGAPAAAWLLGASGALGLTNYLARATGASDAIASYLASTQEAQYKIADRIQTTLSALQFACAAGGIMVTPTGALHLFRGESALTAALNGINMATSFAAPALNLGKEWTNQQLSSLQSKTTSLTKETEKHRMEVQTDINTETLLLKSAENYNKILTEGIHSSKIDS